MPRIDNYEADNGGVQQYAADSNAAARKANADKARIRELQRPKSLWERFKTMFGR